MKRLPPHLVAYQRERTRSRRGRRSPCLGEGSPVLFLSAPELERLAAEVARLAPASRDRLQRFDAWAVGFGDAPPPAAQIRTLAAAWIEADAAGVYVRPGEDPRAALGRAGASFFGVDRTAAPSLGLEVGQEVRISGLNDVLAPAPPCIVPIRAVLSALAVAHDAELEGRHADAWAIRGDAGRMVIAALRVGGVRRCHVEGSYIRNYRIGAVESALTGRRFAR